MTTYNTGTISVAASGTAVTGVGTNWLTAGVRAGDQLIARGLVGIIASVNSATSITLARAWPGTALSGAAYDIALVDDGVRSLVAANALLQALGSGPLTSLGQLSGAANQMAYYTGAGVMALTDLTPFARGLLDDANAAAFWSTIGATAGAAQAYRRGNVLGAVAYSGGAPTGALMERGANSNGEYIRFADGTQICTTLFVIPDGIQIPSGGVYASSPGSWTFPAPFAASTVVVSASCVNNGNIWCSARVADPTASVSLAFSGTPVLVNINIRAMAVGRWL